MTIISLFFSALIPAEYILLKLSRAHKYRIGLEEEGLLREKLLYTIFFWLIAGAPVWSADWSAFRRDASRTGSSDELVQPPLALAWEFKAQDKIVSSAAVVAARVYFGSRDNRLYALDASSGAVVWTFQTGGWVDSSPAVTTDAVYFSSRDGWLYCVKRDTGELLWKYHTGGTDCSSPVVDDGMVFCASAFPNKFSYCLDAGTGREKWRSETEQMVYSSVAVMGSGLYVGANDGNVYCLDKNSGVVKWTYHTAGDIYFATPSLGSDRLFIGGGNFDWNVYALRLTTGEVLWKQGVPDRQPTPTYISSVAASQESIFIVSGYRQQYLYCLNPGTGALKWKAALGSATRLGFSSSPCVTQDMVYVVSAKGRVSAFEMTTGRELWSHDAAADVLASPAVADGKLYVGTLDGRMLAFKEEGV
jgi:outer membrane protein assembly factor BamB